MSQSVALTVIAAAAAVAAASLTALVVGLALFGRELRRAIDSMERLAAHLDSRIEPMEQRMDATLTEACRTLEEVRVRAAEIGETNRLARERLKEVGAVVKFVVDRVESPLVKTVSAAAGLRAALAHLLDGLRNRHSPPHAE